ncbi:hypothetical protein E2F47_22285 [Mycobacterium eburneum]|nr:hypothetical protein [Mycobacterium eburneum]TDH48897.1 hypothetical protein E2F47_22285 [Mycobacterium eburneum]
MTGPQQQAIQGGDPVAAMSTALAIAHDVQKPPTDITVEICDHWYNPQAGSGDYMKLKATWPRLKLPTGSLTLKGGSPLAPAVIACETTVVPVIVTVGQLRWSGRVDVAIDKLDEDGSETVECQLIGDLTILDRILVWPEPFLPIEVQPSEAIYIGPVITVFKTMVAENSMRLQLGLWELFNTLGSLDLDWRTWFGTLLVNNSMTDLMTMTTTPVCVIPEDPLADTSPWIAIHGRMDTCWKLMAQQLKDNGIYPSMDLWRPGDPQPEGLLFDLQVPTYIFNLRDYEGVTGPTDSIVDGAIEDAVDLEGSLLGNVLSPFLNPDNEYVPPGSDIEIAPAIGVNFKPPWVIFNADADQNGLVSLAVAHHHPVCWQLVMGGKSPKWLNDLMNAFFEYAVDMLSMVIGITGIPSDLLDGILDNDFLAFQLFELFDIRKSVGAYGFPERFFPTASTYDIDMVFAAISAAWDVAGYPAAQFSFYNGLPYTLGRDLFPGAMASLIKRGTLYSDYLDEITIIDDDEHRGLIEIQVGDGKREDAPMTQIQRKIVGAEEVAMLALMASPDSG